MLPFLNMQMPIAIIILLFVLITIACRQIIKLAIPIWLIMTAGAAAALLFKQITLFHAVKAIEPEVIFYLLGIFFICQAAEECGYLEQLTDKIFFRAHTGKQALFIIIFILGLSAALLMNDTIAIVGTPIILQLCKHHKKLIKPLLLALAFAITIGSAVSPIGNPQNLLIAVKGGMTSPFTTFIEALTIPTILSLIITYLFITIVFRKILNERIEKPIPVLIKDHQTVLLVKISLIMMLTLIMIKIITDSIYPSVQISFSYITLLSAVPILFSKKKWMFLKNLDWGTLLFFVSTFILMQSVWDSGFFQSHIQSFHITVTNTGVILILSIILSQFISNVPLVTLYIPLLIHHSSLESHLLALAAGSTLAGNLSILGAASNIIIVQNAEKRKSHSFSFFEFTKIGASLTLITILIYAAFL